LDDVVEPEAAASGTDVVPPRISNRSPLPRRNGIVRFADCGCAEARAAMRVRGHAMNADETAVAAVLKEYQTGVERLQRGGWAQTQRARRGIHASVSGMPFPILEMFLFADPVDRCLAAAVATGLSQARPSRRQRWKVRPRHLCRELLEHAFRA